ncbi:MAG: LON peptidase substrate-binding domain-containing protein [Gammaproteobacteria bacterium]|nr:LON peptidase substrate-binding domain-containing protein [Gammaproteobacteria bacterium]
MSTPANARDVPLFPLHTVLFPDGPLALRIFEPRYLDMVSECLRNEQPFGVCLIQSGQEAGEAARPHLTGTFARIVDWQRGDDGLLSISARGDKRFHVQDTRVERDQLLRGTVQPLAPELSAPLPAECDYMTDVLVQLFEQAGDVYAELPKRPDDASWVGYRLAEVLSLPLVRRQHFLELEDPLLRLSQLDQILRDMSNTAEGE